MTYRGGSDSHEAILAHAVARQNLPQRLIVPEASQARRSAQILAAWSVAFDGRIGNGTLRPSTARTTRRWLQKIGVALHERRRPGAGTEVQRPVAPLLGLGVMALRV